ncbi:pilus assembly protein TadG-related protein [Phenylobacterium sp.]|uniref:pilus assembly protein TadG-related protein n=1 Tax=Phenylobacterium sp. TaxID=1871053 RepID=UPI0027339685|nr:pilus assembly protein TadG-related protein [Phenylobacterium sp.]MDP3658793.1 pilus assembly protein TadG-related protein [Phenylobacterium sp.]
MTPDDSTPTADRRPASRAARLLTFLADRRGAIAVWFALAALVLVMFVFCAVDLSRIQSTRTRLQDAVDASAVAVARIGPQTDAQMDLAGDKILKSEYREGTSRLTVSTFKSAPENSVAVNAQATLDPLVSLIWRGPIKIEVNSLVKRGQESPVELVMVLDTTGSMSGARIAALKVAAKNLVTKMTPSGVTNVKLGIVPFGQYVNVGVPARYQPWTDVPADYSVPVTPPCTTITSKTTCQTEKYACTKVNDGVPYNTTCSRNINCVTTPVNPPQQNCPAPYVNKYTFRGCVGSPPYPKNVTDNDTSRRYPGYLNVNCGAEITPLTTNNAKIVSGINALTATGETYLPAGLAWGFNMLSAPIPLTEGAVYDSTGKNLKPRKAMILMTDGTNTLALNPGSGTTKGQHTAPSGTRTIAQTNGYTTELCNNIKAQKIEVFTVAFEVTDATVKGILLNCASDPAHYFDAADAGKLDAAFQNIADALRQIYIAK